MTTRVEAMNVVIERQEDEVDGNITRNGGYKIYAIDSDQRREELTACALNLNGFAFGVSECADIGEYNQTVIVTQETEGGYADLEVKQK
ncbi:hypothetical protein HRTV-25_gp102 [Halorubrum tailed virus 25]|uniref:Uncharacterized protein n=1 Tax=Halorubrum tailed virus 25 TaxID=2878006 RepID=A0AAE9BYX3_9CAUD|nr:hypothetical protein M1M37_gp102 [Halorubrum tailed virus 25]UBF22683.1 hypothetical protein HRTV-25_gp102 [Halorubrum tailed virus 25]